MIIMDNIEKIKTEKEVKNIISERAEIQRLMNDAQWEKLDMYLKHLIIKYEKEPFIYNLANPIKPQSVPENAQNCIIFLNSLLREKLVDIAKR